MGAGSFSWGHSQQVTEQCSWAGDEPLPNTPPNIALQQHTLKKNQRHTAGRPSADVSIHVHCIERLWDVRNNTRKKSIDFDHHQRMTLLAFQVQV